MRSQIEEALANGYSPAEVLDYLSKSDWQDKADQIAKAKEAGYSPDEILGYLTPQKIQTGNPLEAAVGSTKRFLSSALTAAELPFGSEEAAMKGLERQEKITEKPAGSLEAVKQAYEDKGVLGAAKEVATQVPGVIAEQAPLLGSMFGGARVGAMVGGPWGALAGSILAPLISYTGSSVESRAEEQIAQGKPVDINVPGAIASGAGQAALDRLSLGLSGLSRVFGITAKELGTEAAEKLAKESLGAAIAKGTIKTELSEIPTEIAQQAIERYYANKPLTNEDALKEYGDIAYQTSLMGPLGAAGRVYERGETRDKLQAEEQQRTQTLDRIDQERARIDQQVMDAKLEAINAERDRINKIVEEAQTDAEKKKAAEDAVKLANEQLNTLGNKAPEKSKIAKSIAKMQSDFDKAIQEGDVEAQKKAIAELTDVPTNIVSLATQPNVVTDKTLADMNIGFTAAIRRDKVLHGLDPNKPSDNMQIRNVLDALLETKEKGSKQFDGIKKYLDSIPTFEGTQNEAAIVEGSREGVQVPGQPMAGELAGGVEGVDRTGLGGVADNVQQLAGREEPRPAPLASLGIQAYLKKNGGISTEHIQDLTGEKSVNKSGATVGLFTKQGRGLDDAVQLAVEGGYLPSTVLDEVDGGVEALSDLIQDEIYGKKAAPLEEQGNADLEAYLAREEQKAAMAEVAPMRTLEPYPEGTTIEEARAKPRETIGEFLARATPEELEAFRQKNRALDMSDEGRRIRAEEEANKRLAEAAAEEKGILEGPAQQLGEPNPILSKITNGKELLKAATKLASNRSDKAIINMLEKVPNLDTVKFITVNDSTDPRLQGASGYFDPNTNTIFVDPRVLDLSHIVEHELLHAATDAEFDKHVKVENDRHTAITPLGKKAVKLFESFMDASLKRQEGFYGQKNIKEFFMEANTDPKLKQFLQNQKGVLDLKPAKGKVQTLWSDFVNIIKSMFGIPEYAHSMLDEVLLLTPEFMKGPGEITTGKEISQARQAPQQTRADGTPIKYYESDAESLWSKLKEAWGGRQKYFDMLGNKIVGGRYSIERKGIDAGIPEVDAQREGKIRGDLINLAATNAQSIAQSGLYRGRLDLRKSGMVISDVSTGPRKVGMMDISKGWYDLLDRATEDLGSKERAYDMLVAGYYGPLYEDLAARNAQVSADEKVNIDEWTDSDKRLAEEAWRRYGTELNDLKEMRNIQRKDVLDFLVKTGLFTREKAQQYLDRSNYVALYRVPKEDEEDFESKPYMRGKGLLGANKEYRLVGSKRAAADPIDNYIANMSWLMERGIRNNAAKETADFIDQLGEGQWMDRPLTDKEKKAVNYVTVNVEGKPKDFIVNDVNDMAAFSASPVVTGFIWDLMRYPVAGLRHGITMMPQFVWNQANEDPIRATITSGNKAGFARNYIDAWASILNNQFKADRTPNADMLNRYGIIGQKDVLDSQDLINMYKGKNKEGWRKYIFVLERMAQGSDLGAREAIYKNAVDELTKEGYDLETAQDYAAVRSHQYMPYQQMGTSRSLAYLRRMMPFVNPPIQGLARDIAAARGRVGNVTKAQGKKMLAWRLAKYAMFTGMYAAFMSGDDDYESKTDDQQDNNFFIAGTRVPVPQEIRPLKVAIERGTRAYVLNAPGADVDSPAMAAAIIRKFWEVVAGFAPMPTIARPLAENYANFDIYSGLPVVGAGQQRKEPAYQYTENTSEVAKVIGAQLNYSPIKIDHLLKGYGGYMGQTLAQMTNYLSSDRPAPPINQMLFIGSMLEGEHDTGARGDFYDLYDKTSSVKATAQALKEQGDIEGLQDYMQENKGYIAVAPTVSNLHNQLVKLRQYRKLITASDMSPADKREALDTLSESENNMLSNIKELHRKAVELNKED